MKFMRPESIVGVFLVSQLTLLLLLIPRFWQRGVAVSYWQQYMMLPVVAVVPIEPVPAPVVVVAPEPAPIIALPPSEPATS